MSSISKKLDEAIDTMGRELVTRLDKAIDQAFQSDLTELQTRIRDLVSRHGVKLGERIAASYATPGAYWREQLAQAERLKTASGRWKRIAALALEWNKAHPTYAVEVS